MSCSIAAVLSDGWAGGNSSDSILEDILYLSGMTSEEDLDESMYNHFILLQNHPVRINSNAFSKLRASSLFSEFQIVALRDYISRHGAILSPRELAGISGFDEELVLHLLPFISFELGADKTPGGARAKSRTFYEISSRVGDKMTLDGKFSNEYLWSILYKVDCGERLALCIASDKAYQGGASRMWKGIPAWVPSLHFSCDWTSCDGTWRIVAGDFKVRYGQGLIAYDGFTMSTVGSLAALDRRSSGFSPAVSFSGSGSKSGVGAEYSLGRLSVSSWCYTPRSAGLEAGGHVGWVFRDWCAGATGVFGCEWSTGGGGGASGGGASGGGGASKGLRLSEIKGKIGADFGGSFGTKWFFFGEGLYNFGARSAEGVAGIKYNGFRSVKLGGRGLFQKGLIQGNTVVESYLGRTWRLNVAAQGAFKVKSIGAKANVELGWKQSNGALGWMAGGSWSNTTKIGYQWTLTRKDLSQSHKITLKNETRYEPAEGLQGIISLQGVVCKGFGVMPAGLVGWKSSGGSGRAAGSGRGSGGNGSAGGYGDAVGSGGAGSAGGSGGAGGAGDSVGFSFRVYLQCAWWYATSWDNRLYLYLRDIPQSFTIPALYKQGLLGNLYGSVKWSAPRGLAGTGVEGVQHRGLAGQGDARRNGKPISGELHLRIGATYYTDAKLTLEGKLGFTLRF